MPFIASVIVYEKSKDNRTLINQLTASLFVKGNVGH